MAWDWMANWEWKKAMDEYDSVINAMKNKQQIRYLLNNYG
jgi:hypothetical protein